MNGEQKLKPEHLSRKAVVYLRQSSQGQVKNNLESQQLQYAMARQAKGLGFDDVEVIDCDLGSSASVAAKRREGFERLLGSIALGEVGLLLSREVSRLLRTDKDFCQLVEVCQVFGTLVADADTIYDTSSMDDQLVLGIKATLSVAELGVLKRRLQEGKENKARRGELYPLLPPGYVWDATGKVVKDPNERVQEAIELVFAKFRELWSIRQTYKWFFDNEVELPVGKVRDGRRRIVFQVPRHTFISCVLHNAFYAGVYAWGRRSTEVVWRDGALRKRVSSPVPAEEARVFIPDHHEGYIDWSTFEENERMIRRNKVSESDESVGAVRAGYGLLTGLLRCGRCGRKIHVRYRGKSGTRPRYLCSGTFTAGGERYCIGFGGATVDRRFAEEILRVLSPLGVRASFEALEQLGSREEERRRSTRRQVEQLEYEVARAFEQYDEVDPRNRLVASELERRWNDKLTQLEQVRARLAALDRSRVQPSAEERETVRLLGERFHDVWNDPACPAELKKKIVRSLVEEVLVDEDPPGTLSFIIHWKGGSHTSFEMERPTRSSYGKTKLEDLEVIRKMAPRYGDDMIARVLNMAGRRTGSGKPWSRARVQTARRKDGIRGHSRTPDDPEILSLQAAVRHTNTSDGTIKKLAAAGILPMQQVVPCAPWEIRRSDLDSAPVREILDRLERTGRLGLGGTSKSQGRLFQRNQGGDHAR